MNRFIKKIGDSEEEDVIFICVQDIVTKEKSFRKMYKVSEYLYQTYLESNVEIIKFGTNDSNKVFILI